MKSLEKYDMIDANMRQGFKRWFKWLGLGLVTGAAILGLSVKTYIASLNRQEVKIAELATGNPTTFGGFTKEGKVRVYYNEGKLTRKIEIRGARQTASYTLPPDKAVDTEVTVMSGESITATVWDSDGGNMSYGWILPSNNTCGLPPYTVRDITPYITAARAAGEPLVSTQCWSDWEDPSDPRLDFNDFVLIFSYIPVESDKACMIQGFKVEGPDNSPSGPFADQIVRLTGGPEDNSNPYFLGGLNLGQTYTASVEPESGYKTGYSACYNRTDCHETVSWDKISDNFTCPTASASGYEVGFVDLWWHFEEQEETEPSPPADESPPPDINQASFVIHKFLDVNNNGIREVGEGTTNRTWEFEYQIDEGEKQSYMIEPGEEEGEKITVNKGVKVKVSELGQEGWLNTTGAELTKTLPDAKQYTFYFGNYPLGGTAPPAGGFPPTQPDTGTPTWLTAGAVGAGMILLIVKWLWL